MSDNERTGWRDRAYSAWHRALPWHLGLIDIDGVEYCKAPYCGKIVALYELCADLTREDKDYAKTLQLAKRADVRAYVVLYQPLGQSDVSAFRVRIVHPYLEPRFRELTPDEWMAELKSLRCHKVEPKAEPVPAARKTSGTHVCAWQRVDAESFACACGEVWRAA